MEKFIIAGKTEGFDYKDAHITRTDNVDYTVSDLKKKGYVIFIVTEQVGRIDTIANTEYEEVKAEIDELLTETFAEARRAVIYRSAIRSIIEFGECYADHPHPSEDVAAHFVDKMSRVAKDAIGAGELEE
jgi:hypothetical protein